MADSIWFRVMVHRIAFTYRAARVRHLLSPAAIRTLPPSGPAAARTVAGIPAHARGSTCSTLQRQTEQVWLIEAPLVLT